jgi:hypothetical protein
MRGRTLFVTTIVAATATIGLLSMHGHAGRRGAPDRGGAIGPDVVAFSIAGQGSFDMDYYGSSGGIGGYAMATVSCNYGDQEANWYGGTDESPLISQNCYRLMNGRFEHIGLAWLKHSFCALSESGCGNCQATNCDTLGIGCADTYWAGLNSNGEAPRSDVNAFTGVYNYPFTVDSSGPSAIRGNLQIHNSDVDPGNNPGARYFVEGQYVTHDDATWGNQMNNATWREIAFNSISSISPVGNPVVTEPAILAWASIDSDVVLTEIIVPNDGKILIGAKASDNGDGTWRYEYAIQNLNSHRSVGRVSIPIGAGAAVSNAGFHDVDYHSGEIFDGTDWPSSVGVDFVAWSTSEYSQNQNANALRWGTLYNFRFDIAAEPEGGLVTLGLFRPGTPTSVTAHSIVPIGEPVDPCDLPYGSCPEDVDEDGVVGVNDLLAIIGNWTDCGDGTYRPLGDVDGDCCVSVNDLLLTIAAWGQDCTPRGACCLGDGGCMDFLTEDECAASKGTYQGDDTGCDAIACPAPGACCFDDGSCDYLMGDACFEAGGVWQGDYVSCADADCPIPGEGDECSSAMIASLGANSFDTTDATPSSPEPDESQCSGTYLDWDNSQDVWFRWVAPESGPIHFTTCDGSSYDTSMAIYAETCDNQVACNGDDDGESGCQAYYSAIDLNVSAGTAYYIRLGGWQGDTGSGTLTIE